MKKLLILSYFFPPCNLTASNRVHGWAKYLVEHGYYPIIVTRNWEVQGASEKERLRKSGEDIKVIKNDRFEVHYLPYKPSLRDYCLNAGMSLLSRVFTLIELVLKNFTLQAIPYRNLYYHARKLMEEDNELRLLFISANPYEQFLFGYRLKKKFTDLKFVAEYRDEWTTSRTYPRARGKNSLIRKLESISEFKWLQHADLVITTCQYFASRIGSKIKRPVEIIGHGVDNDSLSKKKKAIVDQQVFKIVYGGTLYNNQPVEELLEVWSEFSGNKPDVELLFLGSQLENNTENRLRPYFDSCVVATKRVVKAKSDEIQSHAAMLLLLPYEGMTGWPSSKLYHYLAHNKPILFYPSDSDIMEQVLTDTNVGIIPSNREDLLQTLNHYYELWKCKELYPVEAENLYKYSQAYQAQILANHLSQLST